MRTKIIVINGGPGVGKDTFVNLCNEFVSVMNISTVDHVKVAAEILGWDGIKDSRGRKFLSDLKDLSTESCDGPFRIISEKIKDSTKQVIFIHSREPPEISRFCREFDAESLLIKRDTNIEISCHADENVEKYDYDFTIENNGTISELKEIVVKFLKVIIDEK